MVGMLIRRSSLILAFWALAVLGVQVQATVPKPNPGNQATAILVQKLLQDHHFAGKPPSEEKAREWIRAYMEAHL